MKRIAAFTLCLLLALSPALCRAQTMNAKADDEILTYTPINEEKTTLLVGTNGNIYIRKLLAAFNERNPDIQAVEITMTTGTGTARPMANDVASGNAPDILFSAAGYFGAEQTLKYFQNLSDNPVVQHYQAEALERLVVNDNVYWLPGPSAITCMLYNNTLFQQYGWEVPKTFDEFVALCNQIRKDTDGTVQPWNPNAKYETNFNAVTTAFTYEELFGGLNNRRWYEDFCEGKETFAGHMEPYYEMLQTLIDNGILLEEHFSYSATTRGKEFIEGQIAMYNYQVGTTRSDIYDIRYMPFPCTVGDEGFLVDDINSVLGLPIREHTQAEQDAVQRFLEFYTSAEGQDIFINDTLMFSNVKDIPLNNADYLGGITEAVRDGRHFSQLSFSSPNTLSKVSFTNDAKAMLLGEKTAAQCIADIDAAPLKSINVQPPEAIVTVAEDFGILDTSMLMADMYREKARADIGLIPNNVVYRGNIMRIYSGGLNADDIKALKPRSFDNKAALIKVSMTGQQLLDALTHISGYGNVEERAVYAFSGLKCTIAPWAAQDEMYVSVTLADGSAIDAGKLYTVAIWQGTVSDEFITEVLETYEGTWEEFMTEMLKAKGTIAPARDGRITLLWN
ncbi:MAG: extracellular solute-binding protein [Eubacteriales bacterium]|nr:extracellular solute-binding protein [Eubacteriales bacterium]MDD4512785.1 extracellular solute-binding protein [Eubacteriales bacterium]